MGSLFYDQIMADFSVNDLKVSVLLAFFSGIKADFLSHL